MAKPENLPLSAEEETDIVRVEGPRLPTIDDPEPPREVPYQEWDHKTTVVVSGPIGPVAQYPGRRFRSRKEALEYWSEKAKAAGGKVFEDIKVTRQRYIYRIPKGAQ